MKAAIYSRKSKFSPKGESIENQIQMCKDYARHNLISKEIDEFIVYEDEGFSGGNTNRPEFKKLIADAKSKKFDILICYRLDRISRNVADFSTTLELLQSYDIDFVSISEQFDTTTPMGRAMIYISSVFAQLERETIAERVKDNMIELAKLGRWLGGIPPLGFDTKQVTYRDEHLKERSMTQLVPNEEELELVKLVFQKYLELKALSEVEAFLLKNYYKTRKGCNFSKNLIKRIVTNPVYVKADENVFNYLIDQGITVCGKPDNSHALLTYNKLKNTKSKFGTYSREFREKTDWIAAVSNHKGVIDANDWLEAQRILEGNKNKFITSSKSHNALLTGILRCAKCGSRMKIVHGPISKKTGNRIFYYACDLKANSKGTRCTNPNAKVAEVDSEVLRALKEMSNNSSLLLNSLKEKLEVNHRKVIESNSEENILSEISRKEMQISNLTDKLSLDADLYDIFIAKIKSLKLEIDELKSKLKDSKSLCEELENEKISLSYIELLLDKCSLIDSLSQDEVKLIVRGLFSLITWDGESRDLLIKPFDFEEGKKK